MDQSRTIMLKALRERVEDGAYEIDPHKVADAIVERLLQAQCSKPRQP